MVRTEILPAISKYASILASTIGIKKATGTDIAAGYETKLLRQLSSASDEIEIEVERLENVVAKLAKIDDTIKLGYAIRDKLLPGMEKLRSLVDSAETVTAKEYWPYPSYGDILFSVR